MRPEHASANAMLRCYADGDRQGWKKLRDSLPVSIKGIVLDLEQRQRLMFQNNEYRYLPWCTVRPGKQGEGKGE